MKNIFLLSIVSLAILQPLAEAKKFTIINGMGDMIHAKLTMFPGSCSDNIRSVAYKGIPRNGFMEYGDPQPSCSLKRIDVRGKLEKCFVDIGTLPPCPANTFKIHYQQQTCAVKCATNPSALSLPPVSAPLPYLTKFGPRARKSRFEETLKNLKGGQNFTIINGMGDRIDATLTMFPGTCSDNIRSVGFFGMPSDGFMGYGDRQRSCSLQRISARVLGTLGSCHVSPDTLPCNGVNKYQVNYQQDPGCVIKCA